MTDETQAPEGENTQGTANDEPFGMQQAFEAAEAALGTAEGTSEERERPDRATQAVPASTGTTAEEPEHYRWAKGIDGDFDPATGKLIEDRIVKRAYELNRQNQAQAQQIQQIRQALQDPEVRAFFEARSGQRQQAAAQQQPTNQPPAEKTDEQILEEFVLERANRIVAPIIERLERIAPRVEQYRQQQVSAQQDQTYAQLREEFGQDSDGSYVYDRIAPKVAEAFDTAAARLGATRGALVSALVDRGQLYSTIRSIARDIDWERTRQSIAAAQSANVDAKRRTRLSPGRGTPAGAVSPSRKIDSISDAWEAAEEQLAQRA